MYDLDTIHKRNNESELAAALAAVPLTIVEIKAAAEAEDTDWPEPVSL